MRRRTLVIGSVWLLAVLVLAGLAARALAARRLRSGWDQARRDLDAGLLESARHRLARLAEQWPDNGEIALHLGRCELARDRPERALSAWSRASESSPLAGRIALERGRVAIRLGQFTAAEQVLTRVLRQPWPEDADLRNQLLSLLGQEGRFDDARRLIEIRWDDLGRSRSRPGSRDVRLALLREHVGLDFETIPLEGNMAQVQGQADDDRLRLARAYLATRLGRLEEAGAGLEAVLKRGADDPVVWRARMDWAMAAGELGSLRQALDHLSADQIDPTRIQRLRAWLAARRG